MAAKPRQVPDVDAYRAHVDERLDRVLTILAGRPDVVDPTNPDNYHNSLSGRIDRVVDRQDDMEKRTAEAIQALRAAIEAMQRQTDQALVALQSQSFGWDKVTGWLKKHWGKVLLGVVLLAIERDRALDFLRALFGVPADS